ncbi:GDP dissociation inhibitor [Sporodiniella umbellata]|nr:GDP dissociation inhibitor [Sporodiniella umbellata]
MSEVLDEIDFDCIVLGTGLTESILAGAFSRSGKKVLHLDNQPNYGGNWGVFGFRELAQWCFDRNGTTDESAKKVVDALQVEYDRQYASNFKNVHFEVQSALLTKDEIEEIERDFTSGTLTKESIILSAKAGDKELLKNFSSTLNSINSYDTVYQMISFEKLLKSSKLYNIDTTPKLLNSREELVEVLIRSGVGRYLEFKSVDDLYIFDQSIKQLEKVPGSKEDIFTSKSISLIEKRKLMKFLTFAMEYKDNTEIEETIYRTFLEEKFKITGKLLEAIVYAIALIDRDASTKSGLDSTHKFVKSMGRFGKGAYLCTLYGGASEIAQAFCRVCAVYGGVYVLNTPIDRIQVDSSKKECTSIITKDGSEYKCKFLVSSMNYVPVSLLPNQGEFGEWLHRAVVVTDQPLQDGETSDVLAYSVFPPGSDAGNSDHPIYAIHQSEESMACPKKQYVTYFWTASQNKNVLKSGIDLLLNRSQNDPKKENTNCIFKNLSRIL